MNVRARRLALLAILAGSVLVRLPHFDQPMADSLLAKQAYVANRARSIARPPLNPLRSSLDFLDADGGRMAFTDEVPVYHTLLAVGYRLAGERDWVGHALSLAGSLAAIAAFFALVRREWDDRAAVFATVLLSAAPIFIFYGRAVLPEPWMLAMMLIAAASYRKYLDEGTKRALVAASLAAMGAGLFKYFGLIVFIPLAEMAWRKAGSWRGMLSRPFLAMLAAAIVPMAAWMGLVFFRTANPVHSGWVDGKVMPYFVFQYPSIVLTGGFYANVLRRFLVRDCGPMMAALVITIVAHSPWVFGEFFRQDEAKLVLARRLDALCPPGARVVAIGPGIEFPTVIHYSHREGWPVHSPELPDDWRTRLDGFRDSGAALVAVYFGPKTTDAQRASYAPLLRALPVVEQRSGLPTRVSGTSGFVILDLGASRVSDPSQALKKDKGLHRR